MSLKAVERTLKRWATRALAARAHSGPEPHWSAAQLKRIVVLRLDRRLGNQVILFPMLDALKRACPAAELEVVAPGPYHRVYQGRSSVDRVTRFERSSPFSALGAKALRQIAARGADLVIEAGHHHSFSLSGAVAANALGAPLRMGFRRGESPRFLNVLVDVPPGPVRGRARLYFELARRVDPGAAYRPPHWEVSPGEGERARAERERLGLGPRIAALHPGGRGLRQWPAEDFVTVAKGLAERGFQPVVFLGPAEADQAPRWRAEAGGPWRVVPAPEVREFAALIQGAALWVSGDTGPLHVAASLGVPCVGVLRHPESLEALEPGPGYLAVFREGAGPSATDVLAALDRWLESRAAP